MHRVTLLDPELYQRIWDGEIQGLAISASDGRKLLTGKNFTIACSGFSGPEFVCVVSEVWTGTVNELPSEGGNWRRLGFDDRLDLAVFLFKSQPGQYNTESSFSIVYWN